MESLTLSDHFTTIHKELERHSFEPKWDGKVSSVIGTIVECTGLRASDGERYGIHTTTGKVVTAEVVGLKDEKTLLMPYGRLEGKSGRASCREAGWVWGVGRV